MTKTAFGKIKAGLEDALAFARGEADPASYRVHLPPPQIDVRRLRRRLGLTQRDFAARFGFSLARVRDWEQGRSRPDGAMQAYLLVIEREPKAVGRALAGASSATVTQGTAALQPGRLAKTGS